MNDPGMQRHVPFLPACCCILRIHRGLNTVKIFGKQVGILAQNLSDVIETVTKNLGGNAPCVPPVGASHFFTHTFFEGDSKTIFTSLYLKDMW